MTTFLIEGGRPLHGEVTIAGNKNAALPMLAATLLSDETVTLQRVPQIRITMRAFEATFVAVAPRAVLALCCVLLGCGCSSSHHDAAKDGAKGAGDSGNGSGGMNAAGTSGTPHDAGSTTAPPADAMTAAMHDASAPVDAAAPLSACAKRTAVCEHGEVPQAKTAIGEAFQSCALAMTVMSCGSAVATFDAEGCADKIVVRINATPSDAMAKCVADKLADRRFQCAAAQDITFSASCT